MRVAARAVPPVHTGRHPCVYTCMSHGCAASRLVPEFVCIFQYTESVDNIVI